MGAALLERRVEPIPLITQVASYAIVWAELVITASIKQLVSSHNL